MENDPAFREMMTAQYAAAGQPLPGTMQTLATASNLSAPYIPGADAAPTLDQLLGLRPGAPSDPTVSPSGSIPTFGASTNQLDLYRVAFLVAGVAIGYVLFTKS